MEVFSKAYLDEVVENQGKLFEYAQDHCPGMDIEDFIDHYMNSRTRSLIDEGQAYVSTMDAESLFDYLKNYSDITCLVVDEAQFLTERQVLELVIITKDWNIPTICYGLKVDFQGKLFPGSEALLRYADSLNELVAICECGKKARFNARKVGGKYVYDGEQVLIGEDESYDPLCETCFMNKVLIPHSKQFQKIYYRSRNFEE